MKLNSNNYKELLDALQLPEYWEDKLHRKAHKCNAQTLRVLDQLGDSVSGTAVSHKVFSTNTAVRKHAKSVFMKFSSGNAYEFLENDFDDDFNALDQVRIHTSLRNKSNKETLPSLIRWANLAKNENYKAFLIREIGYFKQIDCSERLIEIYRNSSSTLVKKQIVETLGQLKYEPAVDFIISDFEFNYRDIQEVSIQALGTIGSDKAIDFLEKLYYQTINKERLVHILSQLYIADTQGRVYNKIKTQAQSDFEKSLVAYVELNTF